MSRFISSHEVNWLIDKEIFKKYVCKMHMESKYEYILEFDQTYLKNSTN